MLYVICYILYIIYYILYKMASCVTLLLYYKVVVLDFCLEYIHNNGMTLSPDLEEFGKMKCKTISFEIKF
jgi:hypothetical protein